MQVMICAEADAYWCLCKLLDGIQDHYTHAQPGIQRTVFRLEELVRSVWCRHTTSEYYHKCALILADSRACPLGLSTGLCTMLII